MRNKLLVLITLLLCGCATIKAVDWKNEVGNEIRGHSDKPDDHRFSVSTGVEAKLDNDVKVGVKYRNRLTEFEPESMEHGFFCGMSIPLYRK